ncbi:SPOR domain-containing protein [Sphingobium sp. CFD-1]|uniref:SPOR domain-containing protein n=1 Tax=Sphingobium sp. CFD-1 TaxID=2878545 RepID=UPI00214CD759|nr:SPOR domain-containing protein [Sphingobium sp. CFD-1]
MKRSAFGKAAASSLIVAVTMVGCTGAAFRPSMTTASQKGDASKQALAAEKAMAGHDAVRAIRAAEEAVRLKPDNAAYRQLLGLAYVAGGRFVSAETALSDAMALGNQESRTIVNLALVRIALGRSAAAQTLLAANADNVPAADYGLAMAMAGNAPEGVRILSEAIHDPSATARTRQNLAYAYALAGRWKDARLVVGMDLDPLAANQRITQWATIAAPELAPMRVASLMGVSVASDDAGQPVALALAPVAVPVDAVSVQMAAVEEDAPKQIIETADAVPIIAADASPVRVALSPTPVMPDRNIMSGNAISKPLPRKVNAPPLQKAAFIRPVENGASSWVVQLGAYDSAAIAREKWIGMSRSNEVLAAFPVITSQATVNGITFHRLAIKGFAKRADAMSLCRSIQARKGQCFVREGAPNAAPLQWAAAKGRRFASR